VFFIKTLVIPDRVAPIQEFVKIIKKFSAFLVGMIPFLNFPIGLRMLYSGHYMLDLILGEECRKCTLRFPILICLVCEELRAMVGDDFSYPPDIAIVL